MDFQIRNLRVKTSGPVGEIVTHWGQNASLDWAVEKVGVAGL